MEDSFKSYMANRSETELENYLINTKNFTPEAVSAAIAELEVRGRVFQDEELADVKAIINQKLEARSKLEQENYTGNNSSPGYSKSNDMPEYYSNRAVYFFSIFFSVIFGAVLLAVNIKDNKTARWNIIGFGILYTVIALVVLNVFAITSIWSILINAIGGSILAGYFWNKYLGSSIKYQTKPIWKPLLISLLITIPFVAAMLYTMKLGEF